MLRPRRLTLYLLAELGYATLLGIGVWTAILMMNDFFFVARQAIQKDLGAAIILQILALKLPNLLILAIPIGTLLGSLIAVGRLSADGEIVALNAAGLGPGKLVRPMAIHGGLALILSFAIYVFIQPWANYEIHAMQGKILTARNVSSELKPRVFFDKLPGYVLFVDEIPAGTRGLLLRTVLYEAADPNTRSSEQFIIAKKATLAPVAGGQGRLRVVFTDGVAHFFRSSEPESYRSFQFQTFSPEPIETPAWMRATEDAPDKTVADMTLRELRREIGASVQEPDPMLRGYRMRMARAEAHRRFALPFASLLFALLSFPLGVSRVRSGKGAGFAMSLAIVLGYWIVYSVGLEQAREGRIPIVVGVWGANVVIAVWTALAYVRLRATGRMTPWRRLLDRAGMWIARLGRRVGPAPKAAPGTRARSRRIALGVAAVLDRYIGTLYLRMLVLALASTYLIFSLIELKSLIDAVVERKQPTILIVNYFKYFVPGALGLTLPFAAMIAAVVTITLLSRNGEITAFKAAGMSARRVCLPIVVLTTICCAGLFLVQDRIAPETNRRAQAVKDQIQGRNPRTYGWSPGGRWTFGGDGRLYHYRLFDSQSKLFQGLSVFRLDLASARVLGQWFCASARWNGHAWDAEKGWYRSFPEPGAAGDYRRFDREEIAAFDHPDNFMRQERSLVAGNDLPEQESIAELGNQIQELAKSGYDTTRLRVEFWQKTAAIATPLVTVLLAIPFAFKVGRRGSMYGVGVGLVLAIAFWATAAIFSALGLETMLSPLIAAWAPNVLFSAVGIYLQLFIPT